jgi:hypothetical protein
VITSSPAVSRGQTSPGRAQAERAFAVYCGGLRELVLQRLGLDGLHVLADYMSRLSGDAPPAT